MIDAFERHILASWADFAPGAPPPQRIHFVKLGSSDYPPSTEPIVLLAFADRSSHPAAVVKVARIPEIDALIQQEADRLERIRALIPPELARVLPRAVRTGTVNGRRFLIAAGLPGDTELHHTWGLSSVRRCEKTIAAALQWGFDLAFAAPSEPAGLREWLGFESPEAVLAALAPRLQGDDLRRAEPRLREAWEMRWPSGIAHGDFWPGNVLFQGDALSGVVDWPVASLRAPAFVDLLTYEIAFSLHGAYAHEAVDPERARRIHALLPFATARRSLAARGVDIGLASPARFALLLAGALSDGGLWKARERAARAYARLLSSELEHPLAIR